MDTYTVALTLALLTFGFFTGSWWSVFMVRKCIRTQTASILLNMELLLDSLYGEDEEDEEDSEGTEEFTRDDLERTYAHIEAACRMLQKQEEIMRSIFESGGDE